MFDLELETVEMIINSKGLQSDREITDYFALNKEEITTLAKNNQISQIISEEFLESQKIQHQYFNDCILEQSQLVEESVKKQYSDFMRDQFKDSQSIFQQENHNITQVWPKYLGSLSIDIQAEEPQVQLKINQELCLDLGEFKLISNEVNLKRMKYKTVPQMNTLYILLFNKKKEYVYATYKILGIQTQQDEEENNSWNKESLNLLNEKESKELLIKKYKSEAIKALIVLLSLKETILALLTPIEKSLTLLGYIQNRLIGISPEDPYLKIVPVKIILMEKFLSYYSIKDVGEEMSANKQVVQLLANSEIAAQMISKKEELEQQQENDPVISFPSIKMKQDMREQEEEDEEEEIKIKDEENESEDMDIEGEDNGVLSSEIESAQTEIGQILGVNDKTVTDFFIHSEPPRQFVTQLFDFQKQALSWMLFKEGSLSFEDANKIEQQKDNQNPRVLSEFWSQIALLDGSILYYNEYCQELSWQLKKSDDKSKRGGILADEMGLGKTVMALSLIAKNPSKEDHKSRMKIVQKQSEQQKEQNKPKKNNKKEKQLEQPKQVKNFIKAGTLIVVPLSVLNQWVAEVNKHFQKGTVFYYEYYEAKSRGQAILHLYDIVFTTFNILATEFKKYQQDQSQANQSTNLFSYSWHRIILDEAHTIKGKGCYCSRGAYSLEAQFRWCLTGTPIHNCLDDLYSLVNFLKVECFEDYYWWNKHINQCENRKEVFNLLQNLLKPILLRRTKASTYKDGSNIVELPKKTHKMILIPFEKEEQQVYRLVQSRSQSVLKKILSDRKEFLSNYFHVFAMMTKLRQICDHLILFFKKKNYIQIQERIHRLENDKKSYSKVSEDQLAQQFINDLVEDFLIDEQANNNNGVSSEFKKNIVSKIENIDTVEECFCMESFKQEVSLLRCGHCFHQGCILAVLKKQESSFCPICRYQFSYEDIKLIKTCDIKKEAKKYASSIKQQFEKDIEEKKESIKILKLLSYQNSSKLLQIVKETQKVQSRKEKVVIYSQFLEFLSIIQKSLNAADILYTRLDGTMNKRDRAEAIHRFSNNSNITAIVISLKAGAFGLNLIAANNVFICDPWYNPAIEEQAVERCHRIGQTKQVAVKSFIMQNSIEQRILQCQKGKRALIQSTLNMKDSEEQKKINVEANMTQLRYIIGFDQSNKSEEYNNLSTIEEENNQEAQEIELS